MPLQNKVALITGASSGIGKAIATRFAAEGAHVVVNYRPGSETDSEAAQAEAASFGPLSKVASPSFHPKAAMRAFGSSPISAISREANAAIAVFNDLDALYRVFESRAYWLSNKVRISDIYPIIHKYNISYKENWTSKESSYRQMMPHRRLHVDRLTTLIQDSPPDAHPTLSPEQAQEFFAGLPLYDGVVHIMGLEIPWPHQITFAVGSCELVAF